MKLRNDESRKGTMKSQREEIYLKIIEKEKQKNKVESDLIRIKSPLQKENFFDGSD